MQRRAPVIGASVLLLLAAQLSPTTADAACADPAAAGSLEGMQIETSSLDLYETFFADVLQAGEVQRPDHPGLDRIVGYCYRDVLIVVRQDLRTPRPTGWVQINFSVADAAAVHAELDERIRHSPLAGMDESRRNQIVRLRLKPDVRRGRCKAVRLEVAGPEGFMIGFDQFKPETCEGGHQQRGATP